MERRILSDFGLYFAAQCLNYVAITWNMRAVALGYSANVFVSDLLICLINIRMIKRIIKDEHSMAAEWGYILGGAVAR